MKKLFTVSILVMMTIGFTSCSNKKVKGSDNGSEVVTEEISVDDSDFIVDGDGGEEEVLDVSGASNAVAEEEIVVGNNETAPVEEEIIMAPAANDTAEEIIISGDEEYTVQKGETLMWVAFKLYGDYRKWRELQAMNPHINGNVRAGQKIKYTPSNFMWNPKGLPHLIKSGETLGIISNDKYGTTRKWRKIWDNNREMIRKPNLIFAGFTLYYVPEDRDIASENM
jgi:nucleoid-associated protein YgaU